MSERIPAAGGTPSPASPSFSLRARLRYHFDEYMSRGTAALVLALFVATILVVLVATVIIWGAGWVEEEVGFVGVFWRAMLATFDPAIVGAEHGSPAFLLTLLGVTLAGIFVTSILIGILVTGLEGRLAELRKGRSQVVREGHTVILGWSQQIVTVIEELAGAGAQLRPRDIVVLAERDKVLMQDELKARLRPGTHARVICRTGNPLQAGDLRIASIDTARSIVLLPGISDQADASTIKTILAIVNNPLRREAPYHIVAELRRSSNLAAAEIAGGTEAQFVVVDDLVARIIAQTCRQSGVSSVYEQLLDFEGDEIYFVPVPTHMQGETYGDALLRFDTSSVIGIHTGSGVILNPQADRQLDADDRLIAIAADEAAVRHAHAPVGVIREETILPPRDRDRPQERTLILEWNRRAPRIIAELDNYVTPGSRVSVVADTQPPAAVVDGLRASLERQTVDVRTADPTDRTHLEAICAEGYDHVIVLSADDLDPQMADARTLITLLHLRELGARHGYGFSITSEMVDLRNRDLAQVTKADDFIVSDRISSLILSQLSESADLKAVFDDLFDPEGAEVYLHCAAEYVEPGTPTTYATVVEAARRRGETAIGYRDSHLSNDAGSRFGVVLNPPKTQELVLTEADRVIVIADEG